MKTKLITNSIYNQIKYKPLIIAVTIIFLINATPSKAASETGVNTNFGNNSLLSVTTGRWNTSYGYYALSLNSTGNSNTANGVSALYANTSGYNNTGTGVNVLMGNTVGINNTADGISALFSNTSGNYNTANGSSALLSNTIGNRNTADGSLALSSNTTGTRNTAVGYGADVTAGNFTNTVAIGYTAKVDASNKVRIGNTNITVIEGQVPWTSSSDRRLKNHINDLPLGLDFIKKLRPVEYIRKNNSMQTKEWGVIAQELQQTLNEIGYKNAGIVTKDSSPEKNLAIRYNDIIAPIIKAIQEQDKKLLAQQETISSLQRKIEALEKK